MDSLTPAAPAPSSQTQSPPTLRHTWIDAVDAGLTRAAARPAIAMAIVAAFAMLLFLPAFFTLPITDRDEARFAQASRQMAETGDLIDIRLGDGPRYKKPVGIYWLQTAARWIVGGQFDQAIWVYRLPSLVAAVASCLLTYLIALRLMGTRQALLSGLLMATTLTLGAEARIAKTDATLLMTILLAMWPLARLHTTGKLSQP
ncbi:MAG: glycosyltransferase family 39 protein, partial [Pseudomonadota bacterium]